MFKKVHKDTDNVDIQMGRVLVLICHSAQLKFYIIISKGSMSRNYHISKPQSTPLIHMSVCDDDLFELIRDKFYQITDNVVFKYILSFDLTAERGMSILKDHGLSIRIVLITYNCQWCFLT